MRLCACILEKKNTSGVLNGIGALKRVITVYDVLIKLLLEMAHKLLLACDEMHNRHFNDEINATR